MGKSGKGFGGVLAAVAVILGALLLTGIGGITTGIVSKLVKWAGIALVACGVGVVLLVIATIIAAALDSKTDEHQSTKASVYQNIAERNQQLAKLKSSQVVLNMDYKRLKDRIADTDRKIDMCNTNAEKYLREGKEKLAKDELAKKQNLLKSRESLDATAKGYQENLTQLDALISKLSTEIAEMEQRRDSANAKIKMAEAKKSMYGYTDISTGSGNDSLSEYEKQAQYQVDYLEAVKKLEKDLSDNGLPFDKYEDGGEQAVVEEGQENANRQSMMQ